MADFYAYQQEIKKHKAEILNKAYAFLKDKDKAELVMQQVIYSMNIGYKYGYDKTSNLETLINQWTDHYCCVLTSRLGHGLFNIEFF